MASYVSSSLPLAMFTFTISLLLNNALATPTKLHCSHFASHNYRDALTKSILFFEGHRFGKLPPNQKVTWRKDSGLLDGSEMHVDFVGGYYDAGDNVKFGFPMKFTTTMLSWSVIEFGGLMKSELQNAREAIRWSDYLLEATAKPDSIYVQVGDANKDHACWERPEYMDTPRTVIKIDKNNPGSEVAAEIAATLVAASWVFRRTNQAYSKLLISRTTRVFAFADKYRGAYSNSLKIFVCPFYCDYSGYPDASLLWDTYGFPLDQTQLMAEERGLVVDVEGFNKVMNEARERSRNATNKQTGKTMAMHVDATSALHYRGIATMKDIFKLTLENHRSVIKAIYMGSEFMEDVVAGDEVHNQTIHVRYLHFYPP